MRLLIVLATLSTLPACGSRSSSTNPSNGSTETVPGVKDMPHISVLH